MSKIEFDQSANHRIVISLVILVYLFNPFGDAFVFHLTYHIYSEFTISLSLASTFGGNAGGAPCYFPFQYEDVIYHTCTVVNNNGVLWCSTTSNYDEDNEWGNCKSTSKNIYQFI